MEVSALLDGGRRRIDREKGTMIFTIEHSKEGIMDSETLLESDGSLDPGDFEMITFESQIRRRAVSTALVERDDSQIRFELELKVHGYDECTHVSAALDGAFFEDGSFVGPDRSRFFDKFESELNASQDVTAYIANNSDQGLDHVAAQLQSMVDTKSGFSHPIVSVDVYQERKSRYASEFLNIRKERGNAAALAWARRLLFQYPPQLVKR